MLKTHNAHFLRNCSTVRIIFYVEPKSDCLILKPLCFLSCCTPTPAGPRPTNTEQILIFPLPRDNFKNLKPIRVFMDFLIPFHNQMQPMVSSVFTCLQVHSTQSEILINTRPSKYGSMYVLKSYMFSGNVAYCDVDIMFPLIQAKIKLVLLVIRVKCWLTLRIQQKHTFSFSVRLHIHHLHISS